MNLHPNFDFTAEELSVINDTLTKRYGKAIETQSVDIEFSSGAEAENETGSIPAIYWEHKGCHFIVAKTHDARYINQFFYGNEDQYGTGKEFYEDLSECIMTLLQVQADHELSKAGLIK